MSHDAPPSIWGRIFSRDHKVIGLQYFATAVVMALVGGVLALLIRLQLGWPEAQWPLLARLMPDQPCDGYWLGEAGMASRAF